MMRSQMLRRAMCNLPAKVWRLVSQDALKLVLHEITLYAIDMHKNRFIKPFLILWNHFENRNSITHSSPQHLHLHHMKEWGQTGCILTLKDEDRETSYNCQSALPAPAVMYFFQAGVLFSRDNAKFCIFWSILFFFFTNIQLKFCF